ncbi:tyrosine-protein phosphatase [Brevibacterium sp.]|uniref:tyrosine-protein phosphatase n=1 Tax=Brevibacterium sp. TaxID=1701 RepID=UPI00281118D5|nr:tyrosine-protein phosphatase [Brevibacterium sp.]
MTDTKDSKVAFLRSPLANLRDLGGLPADGGRIRFSTLWRADDISHSPKWEVDELRQAGLRTILDLRSEQEHRAIGIGFSDELGLAHQHFPLTPTAADPGTIAMIVEDSRTPAGAGRWYVQLLEQQAENLVLIFRQIVSSEGGVLFHCAAGKDRTGVLAAAVLAVVGADEKTIIDDYSATAANIERIFARLRLTNPAIAAEEDELRRADPNHAMLGACRDSMIAMLNLVGGAPGLVGHLRSAGLDDDLRVGLRTRLVQQHN